jgi:hypothetical protein
MSRRYSNGLILPLIAHKNVAHLFQDKERELALIPPGVLDGKVEVKP